MNRLVFPLSKAVRTGGYTFDEEVSEGELRPRGVASTALKRVRVTGNVAAIDTEYIFRGRLTGTFEQPCDRCLEPAHEVVEQEVTWLFEPFDEAVHAEEPAEGELDFDADEDGERARYYRGEEIDLAPHVWEEMVLASPSKYYCQADCRGLCPVCGTNLNTGACDCAANENETGNTGLAALKDMFPNLPSKSVED